jgi:hypothetical protein
MYHMREGLVFWVVTPQRLEVVVVVGRRIRVEQNVPYIAFDARNVWTSKGTRAQADVCVFRTHVKVLQACELRDLQGCLVQLCIWELALGDDCRFRVTACAQPACL